MVPGVTTDNLENWPVIGTFTLFLFAFVAIGVLSVRRAQKTEVDYLLAGRNVGPWLTALSAVATNSSGFMFVGLIGATYNEGLGSIWIMVGWIGGDWLAWLFVHRRLREKSEARQSLSFSGFLATDHRGQTQRSVAVVGSLITVIFLGTYAGAQLHAGSKALHVLFGWPYASGAMLGAMVIVLYCFSGGIRASIWTDAAQSGVMLTAIAILTGTALYEAGGPFSLYQGLYAEDPDLVRWIPEGLPLGFSPYALGWLGAGLGVIGQPHVMVRAMALRDPKDIRSTRNIYFAWYITFTILCITAGLLCRLLLPKTGSFDSELALPRLAEALLPAGFLGVLLAGLFAATMSTADSQVLVCSAALSQDVLPKTKSGYLVTKMTTIAVALLALGVALFGSKSVFTLVAIAWSALASGLGPVLIVRVFGLPLSGRWALTMMLLGLAASIFWRFGLGLHGAIYEVVPGMVVGLACFGLSRRFN